MTQAFDRTAAARAAKASEQGEHFAIVANHGNWQLGAGARSSGSSGCSYFIEVSVRLCQHGPGFDIQALGRTAVVLQSLRSMGYDIGCEMGLVTCEKSLPAGEVDDELSCIEEMITASGCQGRD